MAVEKKNYNNLNTHTNGSKETNKKIREYCFESETPVGSFYLIRFGLRIYANASKFWAQSCETKRNGIT